MGIIESRNLSHLYEYDGGYNRSLDSITLQIEAGAWIAILGQNGSGKTTFVKHLNALLSVQEGELTIGGLDAKDSANFWKIRQKCGMVFQDPNNQFVSTVVHEDISFGLENYDTPASEIQHHIKRALAVVGMEGYDMKSTHMLSGGQKQRVAIAGVLAINPDIIVFDEATAMLDPAGRQEVLSTIQRLHEKEGKTIIMISHLIEEAILADRVLIFQKGQLISDGTPREILTNATELRAAGMLPPLAVRTFYDLQDAELFLPRCPLTNQELVEGLCQYL